MSLHAARLPGRLNAAGQLQTLSEQDRSHWDRQLIEEGQRLLEHSATGSDVMEYHVEAAIALVHARADQAATTNWAQIVVLYDTLIAIRPSPIIALNRAIAVAQLEGPERGLQEIHSIRDHDRLARYPFYFAALGELELQCQRVDIARDHFKAAVRLARNPMERHFFEQRVAACAFNNGEKPPSGRKPSEIEDHQGLSSSTNQE
jgi:RNA polymerase sigma-70 factor (ECF subfamily)